MKFISGIILVLFLCQQLLSQPIFETKNKEVIVKQKVESQTNWDYSFIKGKPSPKGMLTSYTRYNPRGDIEEYLTYKMKDTLTYETYDYDQQGKRIDYTKHKGGRKNISYQKISKYDDKGNLISENGFDGTEKFRNIYHYNDQGKLSEINYYIENTLSEKRIFQYDGDTTRVSIFNSSGVAMSYMSLKYNDNGNMIEETIYDANKNLMETRIFVYNNESKVVSEVKYLQGNFSYKLTYLYDSRGELINIDEENLENSRYIKKNFKYNDNGYLIEMNWRRKPDEEFNTRNYVYNEQGLCTQVLTYYPSTDFKILTKYEYEFY